MSWSPELASRISPTPVTQQFSSFAGDRTAEGESRSGAVSPAGNLGLIRLRTAKPAAEMSRRILDRLKNICGSDVRNGWKTDVANLGLRTQSTPMIELGRTEDGYGFPELKNPAGEVRFRATIEIRGINPYVLVSAERAAALKRGWRKPMPVRVQIDGQPDPPWRINMMPVGDGSFLLYLHAEVRKAAAREQGDVVDVAVAFDGTYRTAPTHPMPSWFADGLDRLPSAQVNWEGLTPSLQKEFLRYFAGLKSEEARKRNLDKALHVLSGGKARFLARSWSNGRPVSTPARR